MSHHHTRTPAPGSSTTATNNTPSSHAPPSRQVSNISMPEKKAGLFGTSSNLVNSIVGAGIVGLPYAILKSGFVVGLFLLGLVGYLTDKSLRIIVEVASFHPKLKDLGVLTYEDLMAIPFGAWGKRFILANMFILAYGAMVAYLLIIKDTVPTVLGLSDNEKGSFAEREGTMVITSLLIVVPLSMMREMASLAVTSFFSVMADVVLVAFVVLYSPVGTSVSDAGGFGQVLKDNWINSQLFIGLGVLSTAMSCQHSAFIVSGSLENKTALRWSMVTARSITTATLLCGLMGSTGYLGFLNNTQGDILNNFDADSIEANAGRALLAITMFFTYPMESFVARHVLVQMFYNGDMDGQTVGSDGEVIPEQKFLGLFGRRHWLTLAIYCGALVPALIVDDLGPVLSLTGSIGASCIAYIGPGLVYLGINGDDFLIYMADLLQNHSVLQKSSSSTKSRNESSSNGGEVELPVMGDANATMRVSSPEWTQHDHHFGGRTKPWWWWLGGFPVWTAIASSGARGSKEFLDDFAAETGQPLREPRNYDDVDEEVIGPCRRDYYISMFFIVFGVIAVVVGVASNIYVELNDVFFTPH